MFSPFIVPVLLSLICSEQTYEIKFKVESELPYEPLLLLREEAENQLTPSTTYYILAFKIDRKTQRLSTIDTDSKNWWSNSRLVLNIPSTQFLFLKVDLEDHKTSEVLEEWLDGLTKNELDLTKSPENLPFKVKETKHRFAGFFEWQKNALSFRSGKLIYEEGPSSKKRLSISLKGHFNWKNQLELKNYSVRASFTINEHGSSYHYTSKIMRAHAKSFGNLKKWLEEKEKKKEEKESTKTDGKREEGDKQEKEETEKEKEETTGPPSAPTQRPHRPRQLRTGSKISAGQKAIFSFMVLVVILIGGAVIYLVRMSKKVEVKLEK